MARQRTVVTVPSESVRVPTMEEEKFRCRDCGTVFQLVGDGINCTNCGSNDCLPVTGD
jgi:Zn finger protein HypA/HybF involved in hydrogenase expression